MLESPKAKTLADGFIYVRWNRIKNHAQWQRWLIEEKEVRQ